MLDIKYIRDNFDAVKKNCLNRNVHVDLDYLIHLDDNRRSHIKELDELRQRQNENAKSMKAKLSNDERTRFINIGKKLKSEESIVSEKLKKIEEKLDTIVRAIPNMTHPSSPIASTEDGNVELRRWGEPRKFDFKPLDHVNLGKKLNILDFESGAKVAGQKFYYLKGDAVLLEQALICYTMHMLKSKGFTPVTTPDVARESILNGIGFNPRGDETQIYSIENSDLCLIATAEITLGGMLSNKILSEEDLPMKFAGMSHCFRTEAGAAGKESKGLYRVHQFTKVEMFAFATPESSEDIHNSFLSIEEEIFQALNIPYRVVDICTGDLGGPAYRKFDIEAWMPGRGNSGAYGEVTSTSNCTDYQARRLGIRFKRKNEKKPIYAHMLNGTAVATSRALIAIFENYQDVDGCITVPNMLKPFMGKIEKITPA